MNTVCGSPEAGLGAGLESHGSLTALSSRKLYTEMYATFLQMPISTYFFKCTPSCCGAYYFPVGGPSEHAEEPAQRKPRKRKYNIIIAECCVSKLICMMRRKEKLYCTEVERVVGETFR